MSKKNYINLLLIFFCLLPLLLIIVNIFLPGLFTGLDWVAHTSRMISLHDEVKHSQFLPLFDFWNNGYGYSWQAFYPPLTNIYFLLSYLVCYGENNIAHFKFIWLLISLVNFMCAFYAGYRQYKSYWVGLFCAALLLSSAYYLTAIFTRFAIAEYTSFGFIILYIRGLDSFRTDQQDRYLIPLMASLICITNIPTTICIIIMSFFYFLFYFQTFIKKENIIFLLKSLLITIAISAIYFVPLLYNLSGQYIVMSSQTDSYTQIYKSVAKLPLVIFNINPYQNMIFSIGIIGNCLLIISFFKNNICSKKKIIFIVTIIFLTTFLFPWWVFPDKFILFNIMQYPWRLFSTIICLFSLWLSPIILKRNRLIICPLIIILSLLCNYYPYMKAYSHRHYVINDYNNSYLYHDYLNNHTQHNGYYHDFDTSKNIFSNDNQNVNYTIKSSQIRNGFPEYKVVVLQDSIVSLPLIYYNFIKIIINNKNIPTIYTKDGRLGIYLHKGDHTISISQERQQYYMGFILFLIGIMSLIKLKRSDNKMLLKV
ncbi:glycosyltransferase family protein [Commensalibacter papalotli (ex Servin-Garciduenas et al. 2014)]|uniref:Membrane protein 6-pyruvoyl-tetrahydropterin synthase-related domain-containing protein n=1 Tax=Commensalibacter papalotli (ex Servin-Garciduenas et al. 2014) TaxID=1208583 RepID=W7E0X3_9PROT|nr:hypothetical protein [Commensalibacter papalotli (ex Servin-Garciduenas et al. 2014)]EUK18669.1 hypothetical protein COMX_02935 [Commensalibacter papalotli (ex Servin-Garciduenas et al. 2014)]